MDRLLTLSGSALAAMIRRREVTSLDVVNAHITRIEVVNSRINALAEPRYARAREEAREVDRRVSEGDETLPPFAGVPCTIKESFAVEGMPNTAGLLARKGIVSKSDAVTVARVRAAGAIPLGVTNTSELCMWHESNNHVYGRTTCAYSTDHISGGSSGGEGAIVGAGGTPFGIGSDIGGSIRMPAFFNGVFGHKPSGGLVPSTGQYPPAQGKAKRMLATGPIARRAEDLMPLLSILAGPDGEDPECEKWPLEDPEKVDLASLEVISVEGNGRMKTDSRLLRAQREAGRWLEAHGAALEKIELPELTRSFEIWAATMADASTTSFASLLGNGKAVRPWRELARFLLRPSPFTLPALVLAIVETLPGFHGARGKKLLEAGRRFREELSDRLGKHGVLLFPSYPVMVPKHGEPLWRPFDWTYTAIWNVLEVPVTQVPLGLSKEGLPLGVQVIAAPGNDHLTIAVARELERENGGWVPPPWLDVPLLPPARRRGLTATAGRDRPAARRSASAPASRP